MDNPCGKWETNKCRYTQDDKVAFQYQPYDVFCLGTMHLAEGYLAVAQADFEERQAQQSQTRYDNGQSGKCQVDVHYTAVVLVLFGYLGLYKGVFPLAIARNLIAQLGK